MKNCKIMIESSGIAHLQEDEIPELQPDQVLIRNHFTAVSAGTERAWSLHMPNTHTIYPYMPGYSGAGEVVKIPESVSMK